MTPDELAKWVELLGKMPTLAVVLAWGILELRRFLGALTAHMGAEEALLRDIRDRLPGRREL
jgi:hypothetical protein